MRGIADERENRAKIKRLFIVAALSVVLSGMPADWHFYDSAYTERYMGMPKASAGDYERTSVLPKAADLQGDLLLLAGSGDDNVHIMNTFSLAQAFIANGKSRRHCTVRPLYTRTLVVGTRIALSM